MTTDRIKEIQAETAYPNSTSVQQALMKVWNECEQEQKQVKNCSIPDVSTRFLFEWFDKKLETKRWETYAESKKEAEIKFNNRTYLMENSLDGKYKCYSINVC